MAVLQAFTRLKKFFFLGEVGLGVGVWGFGGNADIFQLSVHGIREETVYLQNVLLRDDLLLRKKFLALRVLELTLTLATLDCWFA